MNERFPLRFFLIGPLVALAFDGIAQPRAASCFFSADFEGTDALSGWNIGDSVETQTADGIALGVRAAAWTIGDASAANADGYFPVADQPIGNHFAMANDAASPCNCGMSDVALITPAFDLSTRTGVALECRIFSEGTLNAGTATVEGNFNGGSWIALSTLPTMMNEWQPIFINLSAFDGQQDVRLRFRWNDGGGWSSGFAMDDFCLRERLANDISVNRVFIGDPAITTFDGSIQSLAYRQLPLEQFDSLLFGMEITNRGTAPATLNEIGARLFWNGDLVTTLTTTGPGELVPGERSIVAFGSSWSPPSVGELVITGFIPPEFVDDDATDNEGSASIHYTGPGWEAGYGAMATDATPVEGTLGGTENFVLANRMEIVAPGSTARGISVLLSGSSNVGEEIRALLMDANFSFLDTSIRHVIDQQDLDNAVSGQPLYLALSASPALGTGDHFAGIQHLKTGVDGLVEVAMSGPAPFGGSVLLEGLTFDLSYVRTTPMVRLHLADLGTGLPDPTATAAMAVFPVPASSEVTIRFEATSTARFQAALLDAAGRRVGTWALGVMPGGTINHTMDLTGIAQGSYTIEVSSAGQCWRGRVQVVH